MRDVGRTGNRVGEYSSASDQTPIPEHRCGDSDQMIDTCCMWAIDVDVTCDEDVCVPRCEVRMTDGRQLGLWECA